MPVMSGLLGLIFGLFALVWAVVFTAVGLAALFALLIPLLILGIFFRVGLGLMRVAAVIMLLCVVAICIH
jgi:hypothetical protein